MCKNMQELLQYVANKRKQRSFQHYKLAKTDGECGSFTDKEYKQVKIYQKSNYSKRKKHVYGSYWREYTQKYDVKQLKLINKV
mgnify:FL=1